LGSNLKRPKEQLEKAKQLIESRIGKIVLASSIYKTAPWGKKDQPWFYNQVVKLYSSLSGANLLRNFQEIEFTMGRRLTEKWGPRIIDIDILFIGYQRIKTNTLEIPHPRIIERKFVLAPLNELIPRFRHPIFNTTIHTLFQLCTDPLAVQRVR
jgi:2-amino-4-hydroxy-6-hydroxymethyldihydropteridine diphosphokinase